MNHKHADPVLMFFFYGLMLLGGYKIWVVITGIRLIWPW